MLPCDGGVDGGSGNGVVGVHRGTWVVVEHWRAEWDAGAGGRSELGVA